MRKRSRIQALSLCAGGLVLGAGAGHAFAQSVSGNTSTTGVSYGSNVPGTGALSTQTINTGFGDSTVGDGTSNGGSELDAAYGTTQNGYLYIFLAGNYEDNGNHVNVFIDDGRAGGQNVLNASNASGPLNAMNGSVFSSGFDATYALDANDYQGTLYVDQYDLVKGTANYLGSIPLSGGTGANQNLSGLQFGFNNTHVSTMGASGTAANQTAMQSTSTGLEIGIPLSVLGNPPTTGNPAVNPYIMVMADINGGNDGYLSNQFLPGLPLNTANLGAGGTYAGPSSGTFNFATLPNMWFNVPVGAYPNGTWEATGGGTWQVGNGTPWASGYVPHAASDTASFSFATSTSTVTLPATVSVGSISFSDTNSYTIQGTGGTLTMDNGASSATMTDLTGTHFIDAPVQLNSNTMVTVANHGDSLVINGNISGSGSVTINDPGGGGAFALAEVILGGSNSYNGGTEVQTGNLQLGSSNGLPAGTALTLSAVDVPAGTVDLNGFNADVSSITVLTGPNTETLGAVGRIINTSTAAVTSTFTYSGSMANASNFTGDITDNSGSSGASTALVVASGSLTLSGSNSYAGGTSVSNGATLTLFGTAGTSLPVGGNVTNNGALVVSDTIAAGNISGSGSTTITPADSLSAINFSQAAGVINNGSLTVSGSGAIGGINGSGSLTVGGTLQLSHGSGQSSMNSLTINTGGDLDITNTHVIINYGANPSPKSTILGYLTNGSNGGLWNGTTGIISSTAANLVGQNYGVSFSDGADGINPALTSGEIEVAYSQYGDITQQGLVNAADFHILASNFGQVTTNGWEAGDFFYTGTVNAEDFHLLAENFGQTASGESVSMPASDWAALDAFAAANGLGPVTVPEPATLGVLALAGAGLLTRRRRHMF